MSLLELLFSISILAILVISAYMSYQGYIEDARTAAAQNRMDTVRKAFEAWLADHSSPFPSGTLDPLLGRYLPAIEDDGWGNPFVIDPFFLRVVSLGPNGLLDTPVPGEPLSPPPGYPYIPSWSRPIIEDDLLVEVRAMGRILLVGGGLVVSVRPDGMDQGVLVDAVGSADQAPGSGLVVYSQGTKLYRDWVTEEGARGVSVARTRGVGEGRYTDWESLPPMELTTVWDPVVGMGSYGTVAIAPDGYHVAALQLMAPAVVRLVVGEALEAGLSGAPPTVVTTFPASLVNTTNGHLRHLSWDRASSKIYLHDEAGDVLQITAAPGSQPTTPTWGDHTVVPGGFPTFNPDFASARDRMVFVRDGKTCVADGGGRIIQKDVGGVFTTLAQAVHAGGDLLVALNGVGDAVAVVGTVSGKKRLSVWWPDRPWSASNPWVVYPDLSTPPGPGMADVTDLKWR